MTIHLAVRLTDLGRVSLLTSSSTDHIVRRALGQGVIRRGWMSRIGARAAVLVGTLFVVGVAAMATPVPALAAGAPGSSPWSWQNPLPVGNDLGDISCPTASVCYVGGVPGAVLVTNNGGASWFTRPVLPGVGAISCPTELVCSLAVATTHSSTP